MELLQGDKAGRLCYTSKFKAFASSIDISSLCGRNVADLLLGRLFDRVVNLI